MKRLEISGLMDEYRDDEFFPEGGSTADTQAVKDQVLANVKPAEPKKQTPRKKKVLIAAALAAVMVVLVGAGYPYIQHHLVDGALTFEQTGNGGRITSFVHYGSPIVKLEDNRILFKQDSGGYLDVTELVSEDTPYIYDGSDPDTGSTYYVVIGGTPECFGWFEWIQVPYAFDGGAHNFDENGNPVSATFGFELNDSEKSWPGVAGFDVSNVPLEPQMNHPWLIVSLDELGIPYEYAQPEPSGSYVTEEGSYVLH